MKKTYPIFCLITILFMYSCKPVYIPNAVNIPYLSEKGQINGGLHTGTSGIDLQGAYAITDHVAVMANGSYANRDGSDTSLTNDHKHLFGELGMGYFMPFGAGRFEIYGGAGTGTASSYENFFSQGDVYAKAFYNRYFFQTNIGASARNVEGGLGLRFSFVDFNKFSSNNVEYNRGITRAYMEPVLNLKVGSENIKVTTQIGFSALLSAPPDSSNFMEYVEVQHQPFIFNIGLSFNIGGLSK